MGNYETAYEQIREGIINNFTMADIITDAEVEMPQCGGYGIVDMVYDFLDAQDTDDIINGEVGYEDFCRFAKDNYKDYALDLNGERMGISKYKRLLGCHLIEKGLRLISESETEIVKNP